MRSDSACQLPGVPATFGDSELPRASWGYGFAVRQPRAFAFYNGGLDPDIHSGDQMIRIKDLGNPDDPAIAPGSHYYHQGLEELLGKMAESGYPFWRSSATSATSACSA